MFIHIYILCFFPAARYQNELAGVEAEQLAERFYHQAWSVMPHVGELPLPAVQFCALVFHQPGSMRMGFL